jgi:hypothetical protein
MKQGKTWAALAAILILAGALPAQSLDIPSHRWGISFGNSKNFSGLRFNFRDKGVEHIRGVNITLWQPREKTNEDAVVDGLSFGLIPGGGTLRGVQVGLLGVAGMKNIQGITLGLLGGGSGGSIKGINIGGLGMGAGEDIVGINIGGLGIGAGRDVVGLNVGGLGIGSGRNLTGINIGGLGIGASDDVKGINIGGLGVGTGGDMIGLNIGGLGVGSGRNLTGINIGGLGVGAGESLSGLTFVGLAAGAPKVRGLVAAGFAAGGQDVRGVLLAGAFTTVPTGGEIRGLAASPVNWFKGSQTGLSFGIVNYAWSLKGLQIGLINIVRDNPPGLKVLPVFNAGF